MDWILCSDRLPDNDNNVLVTCRTLKGVLSVNRAYYWNGYWHGPVLCPVLLHGCRYQNLIPVNRYGFL